MKILKDGKEKGGHKFEVLRPFLYEGQVLKVGETIKPDLTNKDMASFIFGMAQRGKLKPILPKTGIYEAARGFTTSVTGKPEDIKPGELVELDAETALPLLLNGTVLAMGNIYCPFKKKRKPTISPELLFDIAKTHGSLENWITRRGREPK
jgi:hypothetical protein